MIVDEVINYRLRLLIVFILMILVKQAFFCDLQSLGTNVISSPRLHSIGMEAEYMQSWKECLFVEWLLLLSYKLWGFRNSSVIEKGAGYMLFKNFRSPVIYHEKDASLEILSQAVQELDDKAGGHSKLLDVVTNRTIQQWAFVVTSTYLCEILQLLLSYFTGCVSADESHNRLFFSDCNHHRILVSDGNGEILDCIGSSPGFEDGDFESAKLRRPAGSYYHPTEDCLYFVDSENHAIRKADMGARTVDTLYPTSTSNKGGIHIWNWIMTKLGLESSGKTNVVETSEVFDSKSLHFPWHLLKSVDDTLFIIDRSASSLVCNFWPTASTKVSPGLLSPSSMLRPPQPPPESLQNLANKVRLHQAVHRALEGCWCIGETERHRHEFVMPLAPFWALVTWTERSPTLEIPHKGNNLLNDGTIGLWLPTLVGQRILKVCGESGVCSNFRLSNLGILGLPYWLNFPLETFYAAGNGLLGTPIDHVEYLDLLPGRIDINLNVDIPVDFELVEPLQESCIWCQARGAATEISGMDEVPGSLYKAGVAQQWYDELDYLAAPKPESEINVQDDNLDKNSLVEDDEKVRISCVVCTSPGTSEVIIYAVLHCKLRRIPNSNEGNREEHAARILDILTSKRSGKIERDSWTAFLLQSKGDVRDLIFMLPLHVRIRLNSLDHPKADNGRDIILTDSSIKVNVFLS
ncbi:uncharacterized protein HKW66_Vig0202700 [Vigna angularis]|uniref:Uncharacterized protein n=1 Tax=Phaseolus angularis TaxID=3914 RepID=A0A8T0JUQ1_PHAAN|nr:uncharacterized protein HKW66_Vig0202700 [Vigna angularis]